MTKITEILLSSLLPQGFLASKNKFVAVKKINVFEKVSLPRPQDQVRRPSLNTLLPPLISLSLHSTPPSLPEHSCAQDMRHQMMNDIKALCDAG